MRRDMELIRKLIFVIEESNCQLSASEVEIDGFNIDQIAYHMYLLIDAELADGSWEQPRGEPYDADIRRLTSAGHDFADAARNDTVWHRVTLTIANSVGGVALGVFISLLRRETRRLVGLPEEGP